MEVFCAPTLEQETEEIARRVLEEAARGRPFHEMGIVLRTRDPYAPALTTALARFGIPARGESDTCMKQRGLLASQG